jgi:8-oxo-dGTP pyrophosphatase MutT (NUDIX family)/GNAT superfamily N-acetyltransferase
MAKSEESAKKRKAVASVAVFNPEGKMLWGKRNDTGKWTLTGGHLNAGELPVKGAVRELFEEAGLIPDELHDLGSEEVDSYDGKHKIKVHAFKAICGGKPHSKNDPDKECDEWNWVDVTNNKVPDEILNNLHSPKNVTLKLLGMQDWDELGKSEEQLEKNIGFLTFPKLGVHQLPTMPYTGGSPKAEMIHFGEDAGKARGQMRATFVRGDSTPEEYRKMHGYVKGGTLTMPRGTQADLQMHGTTAHEGQHSAFMRVGQIHSPVRQRMLTRFLHDQLNPQEQDALQKIASRSGYVRPPEGKRFAEYDYYEEALASLQNYLQDSNFRNAVHTDLMKPAAANDTHHGKIFADNDPIVAKYPHLLSQRKLHDSAKSAWRKLMSVAPHVEYNGKEMVVNPTVNKSEEEDLNKMAIADLAAGKLIGQKEPTERNRSARFDYDYSHLLPEDARNAGYSIRLEYSTRNPDLPHSDGVYSAYLKHDGKTVGTVLGDHSHDKSLIDTHSTIDEAHRGLGFGKALYTAALTHAYHVLGAREVKGQPLSEEASRVHSSLAREHGMDYKPSYEGSFFNKKDKKTEHVYSHLGYAIKSEEDLTKMAIADLQVGERVNESGTSSRYDYTHMVPEYEKDGYEMVVVHRKSPTTNVPHLQTYLYHNKRAVGEVKGFVDGKEIELHSDLKPEYQGKRLGNAMYNAILTHANSLGIQGVKGHRLTAAGHRANDSISREHGLDYKPEVIGAVTTELGPTPTLYRHGGYTIKSEEGLDEVLNRIENIFSLLKSDKIHSTSDQTVTDLHRAPEAHLNADYYRITPAVYQKYTNYGREGSVKGKQFISDPEPSIGSGVAQAFDNHRDLDAYIKDSYEPFLTSKLLPQSPQKPVVFLAPVPIRSLHHGNHSPYLKVDHLHNVAISTDKRGRIPFYYAIAKEHQAQGRAHPLVAPLIANYEAGPSSDHVLSIVDGNGRSVSARTAGATHMLAYVQMKHEDIPHFLKMIHDTANNPEGHVRTIMNAPNLPSEFHIHQIPTLLDNVQKSEIIDRFDKLLKSLI